MATAPSHSTRRTAFSQPGGAEREDAGRQETIDLIDPSSTSAWIVWCIGKIQNNENDWLLACLESQIFQRLRKAIKRHCGVDVQVLVTAFAAIQAFRKAISEMLHMVLSRFKQQVTSSVEIAATDEPLQRGMLNFLHEMPANRSKWRMSGQYEISDMNGVLRPASGQIKQSFRIGWRQFWLEAPSIAEIETSRRSQQDANAPMVIRCLGTSNDPVKALISDIRKSVALSGSIQIEKRLPDETNRSYRLMRALNTIDIDKTTLDAIRTDAEAFFDHTTPQFCIDTGMPNRRGYLLYGAPGTGKTSLSKALASHANVPLVIITMAGMDDAMLEGAFTNLPSSCVVLLEDIDFAGAQVGDRKQASQAAKDGNADVGTTQPDCGQCEAQIKAFEEKIERLLRAHQEEMGARQDRYEAYMAGQSQLSEEYNDDRHDYGYGGYGENQEPRTLRANNSAPKQVTLSGLLNVIDGAAAAEGRLLIMTTNVPKRLDAALIRKGLVDRSFFIDFATKGTAEATFKRIFGRDACKRYTIEAIDRFAKAFRDQFPRHSRIPTSKVAAYCAQYRHRPREAVQDFAEYLRVGDAAFAHSIDDPVEEEENIVFNETESYNAADLELRPGEEIGAKDPESDESGAAPEWTVDDDVFHYVSRYWG